MDSSKGETNACVLAQEDVFASVISVFEEQPSDGEEDGLPPSFDCRADLVPFRQKFGPRYRLPWLNHLLFVVQ